MKKYQKVINVATPTKPYHKNNMTNAICPNCNMIYPTDMNGKFEKHKHCHNCGQALDWSDE